MLQEIKTEKFEGLLIKLPEGAFNPTISKDWWLYWAITGSRNTGQEELPQGEWKLIGNPFELSEEECRNLIPKWMDTDGIHGYLHIGIYNNAKPAFDSLLKSLQVYKDNPHGITEPQLTEPDISSQYYGCQLDDQYRWRQAEERTGNWILLEKLNN